MADKKNTPGIKQLPDGRYRLLVKLTDPRTKKATYTERTLDHGATLGEAVDARAALVESLKAGQTPSKKSEPPTLGGYTKSWLKVRAKRIRASTLKSYSVRFVQHILPHLGDIPLGELRRSDIEGWLGWLEQDSGLALRTQRALWAQLLMVVRDAAADLGLPDPTQRLSGPRGRVEPVGRALLREELFRLLAATEKHPLHVAAYVSLLAYTGLRSSEAAGLARADLEFGNLDEAWVVVRRAKTPSGVRRVPVPRVAAELIERHLATAPQSSWVWPNRDDPSRIIHEGTGLLWVEAVARTAEVGVVKPHDLRRTFITLANRAGIDRLALQAVVGHSRPEMTDAYVRTSNRDRREVLSVLVGGLDSKVGP